MDCRVRLKAPVRRGMLAFNVMAMNDERTYLRTWVSTQATQELKKLLEEKHLYQKFTVDSPPRKYGDANIVLDVDYTSSSKSILQFQGL